MDVKITLPLTILLYCTVFLNFCKSEECGQDELLACSKPLKALMDTSELSFVTRKEELDKLCPDLHAGLHCIRSYTRRCMNIRQRDHFNKLYHGTSEVIHEICKEGPYQEDFLRHAPCMNHVKIQYDVCSERYQETMARIAEATDAKEEEYRRQRYSSHLRSPDELEDSSNETKALTEEGMKEVCCAFKEYIYCSEQKVRRACGDDTAFFTRKFLDKMSHALMRIHCENFKSTPGKCGEPFRSSSQHIVHWKPGTYLLVTLVVWMNYHILNRN